VACFRVYIGFWGCSCTCVSFVRPGFKAAFYELTGDVWMHMAYTLLLLAAAAALASACALS
jgi:hypothetical protein